MFDAGLEAVPVQWHARGEHPRRGIFDLDAGWLILAGNCASVFVQKAALFLHSMCAFGTLSPSE